MRPFRRAKNAIAYVRSNGLRRTARYANRRLSEAYHEWYFGIHTLGDIRRGNLGLESSFFNGYYPTDYRSIYQAFRYLDVRPHEDVFLDFGTGMGRVVIVAATFPFREVIGVEVSPQMNEIAGENLRRARSKLKCQDVKLIQADATTYEIPPEVSIIFFYSSFKGPVLASVLGNIRESVRRSPRRLLIVYKNTSHLETVLDQYPWLAIRHEFRSSEFNYQGRELNHRVVIFEARP